MAKENEIKKYTAADIDRYHKGLLSPKERHDLEKAALDDPFLADALEGYATAGVHTAEDLAELQQRLQNRVSNQRSKVVPLPQNKKKYKPVDACSCHGNHSCRRRIVGVCARL